MENKNVIIILVVIIIVLAVIAGIMFLQSMDVKKPTKVKITSNKTQYEDDANLSIKLTDLNKTPISKEVVNITITNSKGKVVVDDVVKTNSKGIAKLNLELKKGKYVVNASYVGNQNYTGNNTIQNLTIKEEVKQSDSSQSSSSSTEYNGRDLSGGSGESVEIEQVHENSGVIEGYKGGRKGIWTPSGNFIEEGGGY